MLLRTRIARATAIGALVLAAPALSSCSFATDKVYTPGPGANDRSERVDVLNAVIVATKDGSGTLVTSLVNNDSVAVGEQAGSADKKLTEVSGDVTAELSEPILVRAGDYTRIATLEEKPLPEREGRDVAGIKVTGDFKAGDFVKVTFTFDEGKPVTLDVPVVNNNGHWAGQDGEKLTPTDRHATDPGVAKDEDGGQGGAEGEESH
jgi:hypothetical protein